MNRAGCRDCGDVITSTHRHDYVTCKCGNISVDGGDTYNKRSFADKLPVELPTAVDVLNFHVTYRAEQRELRAYAAGIDFIVQHGRAGEPTRVEHDACGTGACCGAC